MNLYNKSNRFVYFPVNLQNEPIATTYDLNGNFFTISNETFSILGDSYSTFSGHIPSENNTWYPGNDVDTVDKTWWKLFEQETGIVLIINESYSGSTICYDGYGDGTNDASNTSFASRVENVQNSGFIFIFGGTNDDWVGVSLGEYKYDNISETDKECFRPALAYVINRCKTLFPNANVITVINTGLSAEITESMETICDELRVGCIKLKSIDKQDEHPTSMGMKNIAEQIINFIT